MISSDQSIRRRLMRMMMLTCAASIGLAAFTFIIYELIASRNEAREQLAALARIVASSSTASLAFRAEDDAHEVLATLRSEPRIIAAALYDDAGEVFATYPPDIDRSALDFTERAEGFVFAGEYLEGFQAVSEVADRPLGSLFLRADLEPIYQRFTLYGAIATAITLLSLLLAFVLSSVFQRRLSEPILSLAGTARAISERGDFSVRAPHTQLPELDVLTTAFNQMLERIESQSSALHENETRLRAVLKSAQAQLARLDLLQRTTRAIAERQDLQSIYQVILGSLEEDLPIDFGCLCEYDTERRTLTVKSMGGPVAPAFQFGVGDLLPVDDATLARCVSGALVYEPDLAMVELPFSKTIVAAGVHSFVAAPLSVESTVFGVLLVGRTAPAAFSSGDCEFLRQLSEHVALAAHQVQLNTALQRAYDELRQSQQVITQQERLRALGQMASGVAHDINNAISPIALYTESLLEREPTLSERAREYLRIIQRAIEDVAQTVAKMREFYRKRDDAADLQPIELNPLVEQVLQSTRARWADIPQERGIVIEARSDLGSDLPRLMGSESDIRDALTNLVFNAVDAMPNGGSIVVRTRCKDGQSDAPHVELEVSDTGLGMDEETRRRCLEPFFTTKGERGTGMGLAMVYGMVRRHGAAIEIDSAPGTGTTIRVRFRAAQESATQHRVAPTPTQLSPLHVLVVDDDPLVLEAVTHVLTNEGHRAECADGGAAGIEKFATAHRERAPFDLVMTDLGMPFVDGRAVASAVKRLAPDTPVLLLTGWGERLHTEQTIPPNVDRVLSKPPRIAELRRALVELTQRETGRDAKTAGVSFGA